MSGLLCKTVSTTPPGSPRETIWNIPWNCALGCKKLSADSLTPTLGALGCEFPSMPCKQAKHTLVVTEHPQTEIPEFISCLAELSTRDFWESKSVCQTLLAGFLLHQNAVVLSK